MSPQRGQKFYLTGGEKLKPMSVFEPSRRLYQHGFSAGVSLKVCDTVYIDGDVALKVSGILPHDSLT